MPERPSSPPSLLPREHGAWGMLLQPFAAGALLSWRWSWWYLPALALLVLGFVLREPLLILARQQFVWRSPHPLAHRARVWLAVELAALAACAAALTRAVPVAALLAFLAAGGVLTALAVWVTIRNRQRSRMFQSASAAALGAAAPFAAYISTGSLPAWVWPLWLLITLHSIAAISVVHARLERRIGSRGASAPDDAAPGYRFEWLQIPFAALAFLHPALALPPLLSFTLNIMELRRLQTAAGLREPLQRVGYRTLAFSLLHKFATLACLWPLAHPRA